MSRDSRGRFAAKRQYFSTAEENTDDEAPRSVRNRPKKKVARTETDVSSRVLRSQNVSIVLSVTDTVSKPKVQQDSRRRRPNGRFLPNPRPTSSRKTTSNRPKARDRTKQPTESFTRRITRSALTTDAEGDDQEEIEAQENRRHSGFDSSQRTLRCHRNTRELNQKLTSHQRDQQRLPSNEEENRENEEANSYLADYDTETEDPKGRPVRTRVLTRQRERINHRNNQENFPEDTEDEDDLDDYEDAKEDLDGYNTDIGNFDSVSTTLDRANNSNDQNGYARTPAIMHQPKPEIKPLFSTSKDKIIREFFPPAHKAEDVLEKYYECLELKRQKLQKFCDVYQFLQNDTRLRPENAAELWSSERLTVEEQRNRFTRWDDTMAKAILKQTEHEIQLYNNNGGVLRNIPEEQAWMERAKKIERITTEGQNDPESFSLTVFSLGDVAERKEGTNQDYILFSRSLTKLPQTNEPILSLMKKYKLFAKIVKAVEKAGLVWAVVLEELESSVRPGYTLPRGRLYRKFILNILNLFRFFVESKPEYFSVEVIYKESMLFAGIPFTRNGAKLNCPPQS